MRPLFRVLLLVLLLVSSEFLSGCGNNLSAPTGFVTRAVTFTIQWGTTSAADTSGNGSPTTLLAPSAAKSATLKLVQANPDGTDLIFPAKRDLTTLTPVMQKYQVPTPVRVGPTILVATFYLQANPVQSDAPIGALTAAETIQNAATNIPISTVTVPTSVVVTPGQSVMVGKALPLMYAALDKDGNVLPTNANAATIVVATGSNHLTVDGSNVIGISSGQPTVTVTVHTPALTGTGTVDTTSPPETVSVVSSIHVTITPENTSLNVNLPPATLFTATFTAVVTSTDGSPLSDNKVIWSIQEGGDSGLLKANPDGTETYIAPNTAGIYHVIATSHADTSQTATATITVVGGSGSVIIQ